MSRKNVDVVRRGFEAWNEGDMEAMLADLDPRIEYVATGLFPGVAAVYRGHDGWRDFWRDFREVWESLHIEIDELRVVDEQVVALLTFHGRGRAGLEVRRQFGNVFTFRNGLAVRIQAYGDWNQALEAVGLSE